MKLQGVFVAAATPFDHTGALYSVKVQHNVEKWSRTSVGGFVLGSLAGEGPLLGEEERVSLWKLVVPHVGDGRLVIADVSAEGVHTAARLSQYAAEAGAHAVVSTAPLQYRNLMDGTESQGLYFRALADRSPLPVILHNAPHAMGFDITPESVAKLADHPNIAGVIEGATQAGRVAQLRSMVPRDFTILTGSESHVLESLQAGAGGMVLSIASAVPYAAIALWEAYRTRDLEAAADWQNRITRPSRFVSEVYGVPGLKLAMDLNGYYGGPPRLPLTRVTEAARADIEEAFEIFRGC